MSDQQSNLPHPPHPAHVHLHQEPPKLETRPVHPDVVARMATEAAEMLRPLKEHPWWNLGLALTGFIPSSYCCFTLFRDISGLLIIPPACAVPLAVAGMIGLLDFLLVCGILAIGDKFFPGAFKAISCKLVAHPGLIAIASFAGVLGGFALWLLSKFV